MKLTHAEVKTIHLILNNPKLLQATKPWFAHDLSQNLTTLEPLGKAISAAENPSDAFMEFQEKCKPFMEEHARKDEAGNPIGTRIQRPSGMVFTHYPMDDPEAYDASIQHIKDEYADVIEAEEERQNDLPEFYNHTVEVELLPLKYSEAPPESLNTEAIRILMKCGILIWDLKRETEETVEGD